MIFCYYESKFVGGEGWGRGQARVSKLFLSKNTNLFFFYFKGKRGGGALE